MAPYIREGRAVRKLMVLALLTVVLAGCAKKDEAPSQGVKFESPPAPDPEASLGSGLLDFTAPKLGGGKVVGSEYAGKDVALWFWAPW